MMPVERTRMAEEQPIGLNGDWAKARLVLHEQLVDED